MKTEAVSAYLIKNSKGEGGGWSGGRRVGVCVWGGGGGGVGRQSERLGGAVWVYKIGLK